MFKARRFEFPLGKKTYVMGILNCTPDSFSDGGLYNTPDKALAHALEMQEYGADIIDIGANSTRFDAVIISAEEEKERLMPVMNELFGKVSAAVSVDTFYPTCAEAVLEAGADIINDVSGVFNPEIAQLCKHYGAGYVVMHNPCGSADVSQYPDGVVNEVRRFFIDTLTLAAKSGLPKNQLCLDIGLGFGKSYEDNLELLREMQWLKFKGVALLAAGSRKRFIGTASGVENSSQRDAGTVAAHTAAIAGGADIIRVHDVFSAVQGARVADAIYRGKTNG
ncbi:MAG: dihydropteroate synthase [Acutalibacteraceae bacterium]|nr:dihydropteroate synthase [Acutalibacteraceae bacterium]